MSNKPIRFCIKFWLDSDVKSKYIVNGFPYLEKHERRESSVRLRREVCYTEFYTGCGRNTTTDNFFTIASLAKRNTLLGTIRKNRRELPKVARQTKGNMNRFSTTLYGPNDCTLAIYKAKSNKKVLIHSLMHPSIVTDKNDARL